MNKIAAFNTATAHYFKAVGESALQPSASLSSTAPNGTTYLRNANGLLAVVTSTGKVFDRVGGTRLDGGEGAKEQRRKCREELSPGYVRGLLTAHGSPLRAADIPDSLVELKREQLRLLRLTKELKAVCNEKGAAA